MMVYVLTSDALRIKKVSTDRDAQDSIEELAEGQIREFMDYEECFELQAQHKPDPHEIFRITGFEDIDGIYESIEADPQSINTWLPDSESIDIKGFFFSKVIDGKKYVGIQTFDRRQLITTRFSMMSDKNTFKKIKGTAISFDNKLTAVLVEEEGSLNLYFRSLHNVRRLFEMGQYFREATEADVDSFMGGDLFMNYTENTKTNLVDDWCRKKISFILNEDRFSNQTVDSIKAKAQELGVTIDTSFNEEGEEKIALPDERAPLKRLLRFLDEDMFKASFSDTVYVASGKRREG